MNPRSAKVKFEKGSDFKVGKPPCATYGKWHYREFLLGTSIYF